MLVVDRRGRAGKIVDLVDLDIERFANVVTQELEMGICPEMGDIVPGPGEEIVGAKDLVALVEQSVDQVRTEKTGAAGNKNPFARPASATHLTAPPLDLQAFTMV